MPSDTICLMLHPLYHLRYGKNLPLQGLASASLSQRRRLANALERQHNTVALRIRLAGDVNLTVDHGHNTVPKLSPLISLDAGPQDGLYKPSHV